MEIPFREKYACECADVLVFLTYAQRYIVCGIKSGYPHAYVFDGVSKYKFLHVKLLP